MTTTATTGNTGFFAGVATPDVIKETNGTFTSTPGTFGDIMSPTTTLRKPEMNAARCILYFVLGYIIAR